VATLAGILGLAITVDEFVESKVLTELRPAVAAIRSLMRACAPEAEEAMGYGMPVYRGKKVFAWIIPTKKDVTFGFSRGAAMDDRYGLLRGVGKGSKHLKMKNPWDISKPALKYYIKQAVNLDKR
jgi:hypothetical protein